MNICEEISEDNDGIVSDKNEDEKYVSPYFNSSNVVNIDKDEFRNQRGIKGEKKGKFGTLMEFRSVNPSSDTSDQVDREFGLSELISENREPLSVPPFFNITPRPVPLSPHILVEEELRHNPWALLVATIFLTKTKARQSRPMMRQFFSEFPTPHDVIVTDPMELERFFVNLGLKKRAIMIWKMSYQFMSGNWRRASDLCGIGKYGEDAYRIFILGDMDVDPSDRYLRLYLDWLKKETDFVESLSLEDSDCYF